MPAPLKSYIDRILNVLAEIDNLGGDKKEIYKELAGDGYDRTVVSQVVGHIRKKAAKPGKFAEQSALFDLYLTEYEGVGTRVATHAAREFTEHDADGVIIEPGAMRPQAGATAERDLTTGHTPTWPLIPADAGQVAPIHEPEAAMLPQTAGSETAVATEPETTNGGRHETAAHPEPYVIPGRRRDADRGNGPDMAAAQTGELQRQVQSETDHEPAEGSAEETSAPIRRMSMTPLEPREAGGLKGFGFTVRFDEPQAAMPAQTAGSETAVANSTPGSGAGTVDAGEANWPSEMTTASPANEPETIPPVADPATVVSEAGDRSAVPPPSAAPVVPSNVTAFRTHNPDKHFLNSKGLQRLHGCLTPETCAGSRSKLCFTCSTQHEGPAYSDGAA